MARIAGINLPDDKRIEYALTLIYGIGWGNVQAILRESNIGTEKRIRELTEEELRRVQIIIEKKYKVEGNLKEEIAANIHRLKETNSYRGMRHARNLPVKGQRTRSNARTKRGKRKTVGAIKKEEAARAAPNANK